MELQRGAFMRGTDKMIIKDIPKPTAGPGNVVVSIEYVGICGSDVHYFHSGRVGAELSLKSARALQTSRSATR